MLSPGSAAAAQFRIFAVTTPIRLQVIGALGRLVRRVTLMTRSSVCSAR